MVQSFCFSPDESWTKEKLIHKNFPKNFVRFGIFSGWMRKLVRLDEHQQRLHHSLHFSFSTRQIKKWLTWTHIAASGATEPSCLRGFLLARFWKLHQNAPRTPQWVMSRELPCLNRRTRAVTDQLDFVGYYIGGRRKSIDTQYVTKLGLWQWYTDTSGTFWWWPGYFKKLISYPTGVNNK